MPVTYEDAESPSASSSSAAPKRRGIVYEEGHDPNAELQAAGSMSTSSSPYAYYDPTYRKATGTQSTDELANGIGRSVGDVLSGASNDPVNTANAGAAGVNSGVMHLLASPLDFAGNAVDLLGMGYGLGAHAITGRPAGEFYTPLNRGGNGDGGAGPAGYGDLLANKLDQGTKAIGMGPVASNPAPDNPAARLMYSVGSALPGAVTGRQFVQNAAGGLAQDLVAEAGGDPGSQALAGILGGHAAGTHGMPPPGSPFSREVLTGQRAPSFLPDSGGAAAAMPPQLAKVPPEMRGPLVVALMRGDRDMASRVIEAQTLPVPLELTEGMARQDTDLISRENNDRGSNKQLQERYQNLNQGLIDNLDEVRRQVAPSVVGNDHVQNGQALIDSYKAADEPVRAQISAAYKAVEDANGGSLPINASTFVKAADAALASKLKTRYLPAEVRGQLDDIREAGGQLTFEQYENLRTNLATAARDADRGTLGGGGNAAAAIRVVRDALEEMPIEGASGEVKALADQARSLAKARFDRLRADPAYEAAVDDPTPHGELSPYADEFVRKYVVNGKAANLQRMRANLASDPVAAQTISAAALNYLKSKSGVNLYTNEGNFSQSGYNKALADLQPRLKSLVPPDTAETLQQLGNVARYTMIRPKGSYVNEANTFVAATAKNLGENLLNKVSLGTKAGTVVRERERGIREQKRIERTLSPTRYLAESPDE